MGWVSGRAMGGRVGRWGKEGVKGVGKGRWGRGWGEWMGGRVDEDMKLELVINHKDSK